MFVRDADEKPLNEGLYTIEAQFVTDSLVIHGEVVSPDDRLSDHLNGTSSDVEIRPIEAHRFGGGSHMNLSGSYAHITKAYLLFIVPLAEPTRSPTRANQAWRRTVTRRCWAGAGGYSISGHIHAEAGRDPRLILRSLGEKRFLPFTDATVTFPDGASRDYPAIIVNRYRLELLTLYP
jgi:hypothetical protein